jgi:hypothetical protein
MIMNKDDLVVFQLPLEDFLSICPIFPFSPLTRTLSEPEPEQASPAATVRIKSEPSPLLNDLGAAVRAILLFLYILFEILYELGMDAIKPPAKR